MYSSYTFKQLPLAIQTVPHYATHPYLMKKLAALLLFFSSFLPAQTAYPTPFEKGNGNQTTTYAEMVQYYDQLAEKFPAITVEKFGQDDNGEPIRVVVFSNSPDEDAPVILINNGIHPGEPDGIDATMMLMRDLATGKVKPAKIKVVAIQAYNISGMLRRGSYSRANQNGPEQYGFRGNARNYDLNRDFIKADTENAKAFQQIFRHYQPIYFIDNHVSNGADYQYLFSYISTNRERLGTALAGYFNETMQPALLKQLEKQKILTVPYINVHGDTPESGFAAFMDSPRYATGYTTLFNTPGTVVETHMLKPYADRVRATYQYNLHSVLYTDAHAQEIRNSIAKNSAQYLPGKKYTLQWKTDSTHTQQIDFKGFEAGQKPSNVSGEPRLYYDRTKPFTRKVTFFDRYLPTREVVIPEYYVVPQSERKVLEHLRRNRIQLKTLSRDSLIQVQEYRIAGYNTVKQPYEGHYLHYDTRTSAAMREVLFRQGDVLVSTRQPGVKYLLETLEPEATDSFFNWNFFDAVLGQKEYFSPYVFEDTAADLLQHDANLRKQFEAAKAADAELAKSGSAQLEWLYRHSPYYEGTVGLYPVYRVL